MWVFMRFRRDLDPCQCVIIDLDTCSVDDDMAIWAIDGADLGSGAEVRICSGRMAAKEIKRVDLYVISVRLCRAQHLGLWLGVT